MLKIKEQIFRIIISHFVVDAWVSSTFAEADETHCYIANKDN